MIDEEGGPISVERGTRDRTGSVPRPLPKLTKTVFEVVKQINMDGTTVLMVEQNAGAIGIANRALVMEKGTLVYEGSGDDILDHSEIREAYLGAPA